MKFGFVLLAGFFLNFLSAEVSQPNVLVIVADDLNYDSLGFEGGGVAPDVTPHIDKLARENFLFDNAFVTASVCQPSRQSMLSGLLPLNYGGRGFFPMAEGIATLPAMLNDAGYLTGTIHKMHHMEPEAAFKWDHVNESLGLTAPDGVVGRDPEGMAGGLRRFIEEADEKGKPFFMVVNSADPHRPFHGDPVQVGNWYWGYEPVVLPEPSRVYTADEVVVPPSLPDLPGIRADLARYASSVRRLDDAVGACLGVLSDLQKESSTLVIFVSDNGMPLPFSKFDCYYGSNRTPIIMKWPELIREPKVEGRSLVSAMDITPTVLELAGLSVPEGLDGKSLVPFLEGRTPGDWREEIVFLRNEDIYYGDGIVNALKRNPNFTKHLEKEGWTARPDHSNPGTYSRSKEMRTYFDGKFGYIYNDWYESDGLEKSRLGTGVPYGDPAFNAMVKAAAEMESVQERYIQYLLRAPEELYDWSVDPGSRRNLAQNPEYAEVLMAARKGLRDWMVSHGDPLLKAYQENVD